MDELSFARQRLLDAADRVRQADQLNENAIQAAGYSAEREYAEDMLVLAARAYVALTIDEDIPEAQPAVQS